MNTETVIENPTDKYFECQIAELDNYASNVQEIRRFAQTHKDKLLGTNWSSYPWSKEVKCETKYGPEPVKNAKEIARRFPGLVWKKVKNTFQCGVIDYVSELDGVAIRIENAETIQFKDGGLVSL